MMPELKLPVIPGVEMYDFGSGYFVTWMKFDNRWQWVLSQPAANPRQLGKWVYADEMKAFATAMSRPDGGDSLREALENCVKALEKLKTGHGTIIAKHCWQPISQAKAALAAKDGE